MRDRRRGALGPVQAAAGEGRKDRPARPGTQPEEIVAGMDEGDTAGGGQARDELVDGSGRHPHVARPLQDERGHGELGKPRSGVEGIVGKRGVRGAVNMSPALVRVQFEATGSGSSRIHVRATGREALIKQKIGAKAADRIAEAISQV
ncbi:MAG: hypothetical protein M3459_05585 [Actinomycetota bacterium]|nr:hypothetical protein [Actinomycetota bacterium]